MTALEKLLALSHPGAPAEEDPAADLVLALSAALDGLRLYLAKSDPDDDGDDDSSAKGDSDSDSGHSSHGTYKALIKKGVKPAMAAKMCARSDKKVAATALAESACVILAGLTEPDAGTVPEPSYIGRMVALAAPAGESASERRASAKAGNALDDGSYPIPDKKHLHSAAVLAASKHGNWKAAQSLIRRRARELGVELSSLPGFGSEKVEATMVALAAKAMGDGGIPMHHPPFTGTHVHSHHLTAAHAHPHQHFGDNSHEGGPQHRPGSKPGTGGLGY